MGKDNDLPLAVWYGLAFTVNQRFKNKIYKLEKDDERIPILQLARSRSKITKRKQNRFMNRERWLKVRLKKSRNILG